MTYSTRSVRFLLLKGAKVNVKDKKGKLPIDYVKDVKSSDMQLELYRMLVIISVKFIFLETLKHIEMSIF